MSSSDFFLMVRDAAMDAERCRVQLEDLKMRTHGVQGGGGYEPHTSTSTSADSATRRIDHYLDMEQKLEERRDRDFELIDAACVVLYGKDQVSEGLCSVKGSAWADTLWWRYCAAAKWVEVARNVGYSESQARKIASLALTWIDKTGWCRDIIKDALERF